MLLLENHLGEKNKHTTYVNKYKLHKNTILHMHMKYYLDL